MSQGVFIDRNSTTRPQIPSSSVNNQLLVSSAALSKNAKMTVSEDKRQTPYGTAGSTALTGSSQRMESYNYPVKQPASSNITQADHASNTQIPHSKQGYLHQQLLNHTQYSSNQQQSSQQSSSSPYSRSNNTAAFGSLTRNTSNTSNGSNNNNNHSGSFQQKQQTQLAYKIQQQNQNQQQQQQQQQLQHRRNQTNMENVTKNQQFLEYLNTAINVKAAKAISPKVAAGKSIHNTNTNFNNACVSSQLSTKQMTQKQLKSNNKPTQITTITSATTTTVPITTNQQSTPSANVQKQQQQSHILLNQITKPTNSSISNNNNNCKNSHLKRQNLMLARETQKTQATVAAPPPSNLIDKNLSCKSYSPVIRQTQTLQGDHSHREIDLISNGSKLPIQPSQTTQMFQQWHSIPSQHQDRQLGISSSSTSTGKRTKQRNNSEQLVASRQQQSSQQQQQFLQVTKSIIQEQQQQSAQLEQKLSQLAQKKQIQQISSSSCSGVSGDTAQLKRLSHKNDKINENTEVTDKNINTSVKNACSSSPNGLFFSDDNKQKILLDSKKFFSLAPQSSITTTIKNTQNNNLDSNTSPSNTDFFHKKQASSTKHASSNTLGSLSNTLAGSSVTSNNIATIPSSTHHNGNKSNPLSINNNYLIENKPRSQVSTGIIKHDYNTMKYTSDNTQTTKDQRISPNKKRKEDEDNQNAEDSNQYQLPLKRNNNSKATGEGIQLDNNNSNIISSNYNNIRQPQQQQQQQIQSIIQEIPVGESSNPLSESLSSSSCSSSNIPMASDNQHELSGLQYMSSTMLLRSSSSSREPNRRYERQYSEKQQEINDKIKHILDQRNNSNSTHSQELSWRSPYTLSQELNQRQQYPQQLKANCYKNNQKNQDNCRESIMMQSIVDTNKEYFNSNSNEYNRNMQGNNNNNINNPRQNNDDHTPNRNKIDGNTSVSNSSKKNKIHLKGYSSGQQTAVTPSTCDGKHLNQAHLGSASSVAISHFVISGSSPSNNVQMSTQPYLTTENDDDIRIVLEDQFKTESSQQDCFKTDRTAILTERDLNCRESQLQEYKELENDDDGDRENERNEDKRNFSYEMYEENEDDEEEEEEQDVKVQDRKKGNNEDEYNDESVKIKQLQENQQKYQVNQQQISQKQPETEVSAKLEKRLMNLETEMSSVISRCLHLENMNNSLAENIFKISSQRDQILNENEQYRIRINELMATNRLQEDTISALLGRVQKEQAKGKDLNLSQLKTNRNKTETSNNNNMNSTFEGSHHHWDKNIGFCESLSANAGNTSSHLANSNRINNTTTCCNSNPSTTSAGSRQKKDVNQYFSSIIASTQSTNTQPQTFQGYLSQKSAGTLGLADFKQHDYYLSARHGLVNQQTKQ